MYRDVTEGRAELNFSEWDRPQKEAKESAKVIGAGEMPPRAYLLAHPEARLSPIDRAALAAGLQASLGTQAGEPEASLHHAAPMASRR